MRTVTLYALAALAFWSAMYPPLLPIWIAAVCSVVVAGRRRRRQQRAARLAAVDARRQRARLLALRSLP